MGKYLSLIGIIMVMIGTIFSLFSILTTNSNEIGTYGYMGKKQQEDFKKQKKQVIIGMIIIVIGSGFQVVALFI